MASPQLENGYIRIANELYEAIMQRRFSKIQRDILDLILRLSYGCNKKTAIIPKQKDFSCVGIAESHISDTLAWLISARVISVESGEYSINKDYEQWAVSLVPLYNPSKLTELVSFNLETYGISNPKLTESVSSNTENLPKREVETSRIGKFCTSGIASPKDSIKDNNNNKYNKGGKNNEDKYTSGKLGHMVMQ